MRAIPTDYALVTLATKSSLPMLLTTKDSTKLEILRSFMMINIAFAAGPLVIVSSTEGSKNLLRFHQDTGI